MNCKVFVDCGGKSNLVVSADEVHKLFVDFCERTGSTTCCNEVCSSCSFLFKPVPSVEFKTSSSSNLQDNNDFPHFSDNVQKKRDKRTTNQKQLTRKPYSVRDRQY